MEKKYSILRRDYGRTLAGPQGLTGEIKLLLTKAEIEQNVLAERPDDVNYSCRYSYYVSATNNVLEQYEINRIVADARNK